MSVAPLAVTVSSQTDLALAHTARAFAAEQGLPYFERPHKAALEPYLGQVAEAFLVYGGTGWSIRNALGSFVYSAGMGTVRLKRLERGEDSGDPLLSMLELQRGDTVVDATLGLAADAVVCARVVGPEGRVIGIEKSRPLSLLVREGLRAWPRERSAPIEVVHGDAREVLATMPDASAAVVVFDPMFDKPKKAGSAFDVLRQYACFDPVTPEVLQEARRVARRWVVLKAARYTQAFRRLGLRPEPASRSAPVVFARVRGST